MNELHRLLLASLLHAGEQPARVFADAAVLLFGGTLLLSFKKMLDACWGKAT